MAVLIPKYRQIPVFVYGTLKDKVHGNYIGEATSVDAMFLYGGNFPVASKSMGLGKHRGRIKGQFWKINLDELRVMDHYESYPKFYTREMLPFVIRYEDGLKEFTKAWIYLAPEDGSGVAGTIPAREPIEPDEIGYLTWYDLPF